ncbi:MAG: GNAT family N-acetyltransferase [Granulosicoccus sp.]
MPEGLLELLQATVFGSDGLRYYRLNAEQQIRSLNDPVFFIARDSDQLIGGYILDRRSLQVAGEPVVGFYRGALAVHESWQAQGVGTGLTRCALQWQREMDAGPSISYGCIDASNQRSLRTLGKHDTQVAARLSMYMMYRQWPRKRCSLTPLDATLNENHGTLMDEVYHDCQVRDVTPARQTKALLDRHGIAISASVRICAFRITTMSTAASLATRLLVSPWPPARKRFDPANFRYLSLSGVLIRSGCERHWSAFVSTLMAEAGVHFAMLHIDTKTELFHRLRNSQMLGRWLHSANGSVLVVTQICDRHGQLAKVHDSASRWCVWPVDA